MHTLRRDGCQGQESAWVLKCDDQVPSPPSLPHPNLPLSHPTPWTCLSCSRTQGPTPEVEDELRREERERGEGSERRVGVVGVRAVSISVAFISGSVYRRPPFLCFSVSRRDGRR